MEEQEWEKIYVEEYMKIATAESDGLWNEYDENINIASSHLSIQQMTRLDLMIDDWLESP